MKRLLELLTDFVGPFSPFAGLILLVLNYVFPSIRTAFAMAVLWAIERQIAGWFNLDDWQQYALELVSLIGTLALMQELVHHKTKRARFREAIRTCFFVLAFLSLSGLWATQIYLELNEGVQPIDTEEPDIERDSSEPHSEDSPVPNIFLLIHS